MRSKEHVGRVRRIAVELDVCIGRSIEAVRWNGIPQRRRLPVTTEAVTGVGGDLHAVGVARINVRS